MDLLRKKVVIVCPYSYPSACGVWERVKSDANSLVENGYEVTVFSSNILKGTKTILPESDIYQNIRIRRFKVRFKIGGALFFFFKKELRKINPDYVHAHIYRHPHSFFTLKIAKKLNSKTILTTHAPFLKDPRRSFILKIIDFLFDKILGKSINKFDKVIRITNWELPFLEKLGIHNSVFIPNGIDSIFLKNAPDLSKVLFKKCIYFGRVDPIKRLEWIKYASVKLPEINFYIHGPLNGYNKFENDNISNLKIVLNKFEKEEFIKTTENSDIFLFPSIRESFGIVALEAMSQGLILISSETKGVLEFLNHNENGFVVKNKDELVNTIIKIYSTDQKDVRRIRNNARKTAEKYSSENLNKDLINLYLGL